MSASSHDCDDADADVWEGSLWFRDLPYPEPPPELRERVMASIAAYERQRRIRRTARRIGEIAIAMLLGLLVAINRQRRMDPCKTTMPFGMLKGRKRRVHAIWYRSHARLIVLSIFLYP